MSGQESALEFACGGEQLIGIVSPGRTDHDVGVLIVVGGPQYRVGSHRQFVLLARHLAAAGYPSLRFDYRGMGDSSGDLRNFETVGDDIGAALDAFCVACPAVRRVVVWGLCDAASAILLHWQERRDPRIAGMCLLNPWVRSDATLARTQVRHYYGQRLLQASFWKKLLRGEVGVGRALAEFARKLRQAQALSPSAPAAVASSYQSRMASAVTTFRGPILLLLSDNDYVAREFTDHVAGSREWTTALGQPTVDRQDVTDADHTFSSAAARAKVENACRHWLDRHFAA